MAASTLFRLGDLPSSLGDPYDGLESLPALEHRFDLPSLDEYAAGSERLLEGLENFRFGGRVPTPSRKGKEKEILSSMAGDAVLLAQNETSMSEMWERVVDEGEAGPSSRPTFQTLRTWDVLDRPAREAFELMSERPPLFESLNIALRPSIGAKHLKDDVKPPLDLEVVLRLLVKSTMGTTTTDQVLWDKRHSRFKWSSTSVTGITSPAAESSVQLFLELATAIRRLEMIIDKHSSTPLTPTHHAFLHAASTYLTYLKQRLSDVVDVDAKAKMQWHASIASLREVHKLSSLTCDIMCWPVYDDRAEGLPARASGLLTHLYGHLLARISSTIQSPSALLCAYLLSQSSGPFLSLLHAWLGLSPSPADEDTDPNSQPWLDLGVTRAPLSPAENGDVRWSFEFSAKKMPAFIPRELRRRLFEAGKSLRLLREASLGQHPLCMTVWDLEVGWSWGEEEQYCETSAGTIKTHEKRVRREIEDWRKSVTDRYRLKGSNSTIRLRTSRKERPRLPMSFAQASPLSSRRGSELLVTETSVSVGLDHPVDSLWAQFGLAPGSHLAPTPTPLWAPSPLSTLQSFLQRHSESRRLLPPDSPSLPLYVSSHLLSPLLAHGKLVSTSLVSLYLDDLQLLLHYDILRDYFLGGNVSFFERVSAALFGKDEAGAGEALGLGKRARTRARLGLGGDEKGDQEGGVWGIGLGLGLSERARWPPGGAELAYALRTTLVGEEERTRGGEASVEDRISFAVKSLPEDDKEGRRARWLDPQAIEALDFLYLSYSAPTSITPLLPTSIMSKYQTVHNLLLRLCRVKTVIKTLYLDSIHQTPHFDEPVKRGVDTGSRPSSRAPRATGIRQTQTRTLKELFPARSKVLFVLHRLRFRMSEFISILEQYIVDTAIGSNWGAMRQKLERLKKRAPGSESSRPSTPVDQHHDYATVNDDHADVLSLSDDADSDGMDEPAGLVELHSIDSLMVYHHMILDRILRASLLAPSAGHQVTFKVLMGLFGCILDLGKAVKEVERGMLGWQDGAERVERLNKEWHERETIFLHALDRLALRTPKRATEERQGDERDLEILLGKEGEEEEESVGENGGCLGELLIRLRLSQVVEERGGRWKGSE